MSDLLLRFTENWKNKEFPTNRKLLLALSGGLDSMSLAQLLQRAGFSFAAAHCNFLLRGADADADAAFVAEWCQANGILCHYVQFDTQRLSQERRQSIQVTARELRYEWFEELSKKYGYTGILTAHHSDDVAETVLINLARGTGIAGLHGISEQNGKIIRPLLFATRKEILDYAQGTGLQWREDASNEKDAYLRNAIRLHILPKLEDLLPGAAKRIAETAGRLHATEIIYRKELARRLKKLLQQRGKDWYIPVRLLIRQDGLAAIAYELFTPFGFSAAQIPHLLELLDSETGKQVSSDTHRVIRHRDFLVVTSAESPDADLITIEQVPATVETVAGTFHFSWQDSGASISDDPNVALLDARSIQFPLVLRTRREGDYFYPLGMGMKKKKLKRFLIDMKVPLHEKDHIRILESDKRVLWIAGKRIDERFRLRADSEKILRVEFSALATS